MGVRGPGAAESPQSAHERQLTTRTVPANAAGASSPQAPSSVPAAGVLPSDAFERAERLPPSDAVALAMRARDLTLGPALRGYSYDALLLSHFELIAPGVPPRNPKGNAHLKSGWFSPANPGLVNPAN